MRPELLGRLVAAHLDVFAGLLEVTDGLDESAWATPTGCPGWDVHDQLAHCVGLERRMLGEPAPDVEVAELPRFRSAMQRDVERDVLARRGMPGERLRDEAAQVFARRTRVLEALPPETLDGELDSPLGRMRAVKVLRTRVFDLVAHEQDIRRALRRETGLDGPAADVAVGQVVHAWARAMPRHLGRSGVLGIDIEGRGLLVLDLAQGILVEGETRPLDACLRMRAGDVLALGCGRTDAPRFEEVTASGDRGLARGFVEAAGITP